MFVSSTLSLALALSAQTPLAPVDVVSAASDPVRVEYSATARDPSYFDGGEPFDADRILCEVSEVDHALEVRFEALRDYGIDTKITLIRTDEGRTRAEASAVRRLPSSSGHGTDVTEVRDVHGVVQLLMPDWSPGREVILEFDLQGTLDGAPVKLSGAWDVRNETQSAGLAKSSPAVRENLPSDIHWPMADEVRLFSAPEHWSPNSDLFFSAGAMSLSFDATNRLVGNELDTCLVGRCIDVFEPGVLELDVCDARRCDGRFARIELPVASGRVFAVFAYRPRDASSCRWIFRGEHDLERAFDCDVPIWARPTRGDPPESDPCVVLPRWHDWPVPFASTRCGVRRTAVPGWPDDGQRELHVLDWIAHPPLLRHQNRADPSNWSDLQLTTPRANWTEPEWIVHVRWSPRAK